MAVLQLTMPAASGLSGDRRGIEAIRTARRRADVGHQVECHACNALASTPGMDGMPISWQVVDLYHQVGGRVEQGTFVVCPNHDIDELTEANRRLMLGESACHSDL